MAQERILHYTHGWETGGVEAFIINMFSHMDSSVIFDVVTCGKDTNIFDSKLQTLGGKRIVLHENGWTKIIRIFNRYYKIFRLILGSNYRIFHIHSATSTDYFLALAARLAGAKVIILHSHNDITRHGVSRIRHDIIKNILCKIPTAYCACSISAAKSLFPKRIIASEKVNIIKNGIDIELFKINKKTRTLCKKALDLDAEIVVGHIGRFSQQKNQEFLLKVFKDIVAINENCILLLIGNGPDMHKTQLLAMSLNLINNVRFLGERDDVPTLLQAIDVFVLPSLYEGFPFVAIEAQATGLWLVLSDTITIEADITGRVDFLSLSSPTETWAAHILESAVQPRVDTSDIIRDSVYDAKVMSKRLYELYSQK